MSWLRAYFKLSKTEELGLFWWVGLCLVLLILPRLIQWSVPLFHPDPKPWLVVLESSRASVLPDSCLVASADSNKPVKTLEKSAAPPKPSVKPKRTYTRSKPVVVDIASADTNELRKIYGIGSVLSRRIVKYRDLLGGFYAVEQLQEVYGIDSARYASIRDQVQVQPRIFRTLNINQADFKTLIRHPYLDKNQVKLLLNIRSRQGDFPNIEALKQLPLFEGSQFERLKPYLIVHDRTTTAH
jgi:competence ComEA-like helix-hairpin-helix protein